MPDKGGQMIPPQKIGEKGYGHGEQRQARHAPRGFQRKAHKDIGERHGLRGNFVNVGHAFLKLFIVEVEVH